MINKNLGILGYLTSFFAIMSSGANHTAFAMERQNCVPPLRELSRPQGDTPLIFEKQSQVTRGILSAKQSVIGQAEKRRLDRNQEAIQAIENPGSLTPRQVNELKADIRKALAEFVFIHEKEITDPKALEVWRRIIKGELDPWDGQEVRRYQVAFLEMVSESMLPGGVLYRDFVSRSIEEDGEDSINSMYNYLKVSSARHPKLWELKHWFVTPVYEFHSAEEFVRRILSLPARYQLRSLEASLKKVRALTFLEATFILKGFSRQQRMKAISIIRTKLFEPISSFSNEELKRLLNGLEPIEVAQLIASSIEISEQDALNLNQAVPGLLETISFQPERFNLTFSFTDTRSDYSRHSRDKYPFMIISNTGDLVHRTSQDHFVELPHSGLRLSHQNGQVKGTSDKPKFKRFMGKAVATVSAAGVLGIVALPHEMISAQNQHRQKTEMSVREARQIDTLKVKGNLDIQKALGQLLDSVSWKVTEIRDQLIMDFFYNNLSQLSLVDITRILTNLQNREEKILVVTTVLQENNYFKNHNEQEARAAARILLGSFGKQSGHITFQDWPAWKQIFDLWLLHRGIDPLKAAVEQGHLEN
ncbi:MAG: hypothetical protein IT289_04760 [Oligoflexia bacterium]|nr:hypothetical protein [Oligoflexia bacterium]